MAALSRCPLLGMSVKRGSTVIHVWPLAKSINGKKTEANVSQRKPAMPQQLFGNL